jgi:hypothetical protein
VAGVGALVAAVYANELGARASGAEALTVIPGVPESIEASVHAFHVGVGVCAALLALGGVLGLAGIRNPRREVSCEGCADEALYWPMGQLRSKV